MSEKQHWLKFYCADWRGEIRLATCSLAARGLWMEILCLMNEATPRGSLVTTSGHPYSNATLAALVKASEKEVIRLLVELEREGVFSRDNDGTIYSRRMRRDIEKAQRDKGNGKLGGNPKIKGRHNGGVNPPDNREDKAQKPEAKKDSELRSGATAPQKTIDPDAKLFERARALFGESCGGQIAKLKRLLGGDVGLTRQLIEEIGAKDRPSHYLAATIRKHEGKRETLGKPYRTNTFLDAVLESQRDAEFIQSPSDLPA